MYFSQKLFRYIFRAGYLAVLITSSVPVSGELNKISIGPDVFHIRLDNLLHLVVYFPICIYYLSGLPSGFALFRKNSFLKFIILILFLGIVTELVQLWVPQRAFNVFDLASNGSGVVIVAGVIIAAQRRDGIKV